MVVALIAVVLAVVLVLVSGGGSNHAASTQRAAATGGATSSAGKHAKPHHQATTTASKALPPANAAEIQLAVLNGTETTGLAHRVSTELQQSGYSQAAALAGRPAGTGQQTVVQYTSGHRPEAEAVAHSLSVSQVQAIEPAVASLAGSASVVVIVGADKAG